MPPDEQGSPFDAHITGFPPPGLNKETADLAERGTVELIVKIMEEDQQQKKSGGLGKSQRA